MSDFWSDLGAAVKKAANDVSTEVSIAGKEQKLKEHFQLLGKLYFQAARQGKPLEGPEFSAQMEKIMNLQQQIRDLRDASRVPTDADFEDLT